MNAERFQLTEDRSLWHRAGWRPMILMVELLRTRLRIAASAGRLARWPSGTYTAVLT